MFLPRVMFVNITINRIYTINHGGGGNSELTVSIIRLWDFPLTSTQVSSAYKTVKSN